jgi:putative flavoprotein involved in K+ transport
MDATVGAGHSSAACRAEGPGRGSIFGGLSASEPTESPAVEGAVEVAIVGAGASGLGAAGALRRRGIEAVLLEQSDRVGESWRRRYDALRLNTVRWMSGLPGMRIPRSAGRWPTRDEFVQYLESYVDRNEFEVRTGVSVQRIERAEGGYRLLTSAGALEARFVVVAAGYDHAPRIPDWPGREGFEGELIHSASYRNPAPFEGKHVLVVGVGNTGSELAVDLLNGGAASVSVSMRTPPNLLRRDILGLPATTLAWIGARLSDIGAGSLVDRLGFRLQRRLWGDLEPHGIPRAPFGVATELKVKGLGPVADSGFIAAVKDRRLELVPALERFDGGDAIVEGGRRLSPDVVIAATGYEHGLESLVGDLGVLLPSGRPAVLDDETHPDAPRLYFNGYWLPLPGVLTALNRSSRQIARAIERERKRDS